jgi:hypothetical protein
MKPITASAARFISMRAMITGETLRRAAIITV